MELDSLKEMWKEASDRVMPVPANILSMLQKKSQRPIAKMKRNLWWECVTVIVLYTAAIVYYFVAWHGQYRELGILLFLTGVFCLFYYWRKYRLLSSMECVSCEVKSNMNRQLGMLEKYVRFYFISGTALTPICYFVAGFIVIYKTPGKLTLNPGTSFYVIFIAVGILITVAVYYLNRWYVHKLYGQHVKKLQDIVAQMNDVE